MRIDEVGDYITYLEITLQVLHSFIFVTNEDDCNAHKKKQSILDCFLCISFISTEVPARTGGEKSVSMTILINATLKFVLCLVLLRGI